MDYWKQQYVKCISLCGNVSCVNVSLHSVNTLTERWACSRGCRAPDTSFSEFGVLWLIDFNLNICFPVKVFFNQSQKGLRVELVVVLIGEQITDQLSILNTDSCPVSAYVRVLVGPTVCSSAGFINLVRCRALKENKGNGKGIVSTFRVPTFLWKKNGVVKLQCVLKHRFWFQLAWTFLEMF